MLDATEPVEPGARTPATRAPSPAVDRALTVLETLVDSDEALTLTALAKLTGIPLATCASIVQTLEQRGYAARTVVGRSHFWRPTLRLYGLGTELLRKVDLASVAQPHLRALADELALPAHLGVLEGANVVYVAKAATSDFVQFNTYPGKLAPYNLTALGRAVAAYATEDELATLLDRRAVAHGPNRARTGARAHFLRQLAEVRERGYAVEDEEDEAGISCVAAPVLDVTGHAVASVGVTGFARDFRGRRLTQVIDAVRRHSATLSTRVGHTPRAG